MRLDDVIDLAGLGEIADRRTQKLSGGQAQRVRFAVALASNPELLILDEPTEAMSVAGRRDFWELMRRFATQGKTIIFATHHLEEADANADRLDPPTTPHSASHRRLPGPKVVTAYGVAAVSLGLLYASGLTFGVDLPVHTWLAMTGRIAITLLPFAGLGILFGHYVTVDAVGPVSAGVIVLMAIFSGTWYPVTHGLAQHIGEFLSSYWLVQAGRIFQPGTPLDRRHRLDGRPRHPRRSCLPPSNEPLMTATSESSCCGAPVRRDIAIQSLVMAVGLIVGCHARGLSGVLCRTGNLRRTR